MPNKTAAGPTPRPAPPRLALMITQAVFGGLGTILVALGMHTLLATADPRTAIAGIVLVGTLWFYLVDLLVDMADWALSRPLKEA